MKPVILIIDDERNTREGLARALREEYAILLAENGRAGLEQLRAHPEVDLVLTDLRMPELDGMAFIQEANARENPPLIIMLTAYGTLQTANEALAKGAYDYLSKPVDLGNLEMVIRRGLEARRLRAENLALREQIDQHYGLAGVIGNSPAMASVFETVRQVAPAKTTVMLTGESGTGKELIARIIHRLSPRAKNPFLVVHCAALNPNLLESELFGHEKGAFTGAHERQLGRFERAQGGTLVLDEIGEIDASTQVKLLRVLENRTVERVGGSQSIEIDVRLIAATNKDLKALVGAGKFREDLYYRLNVVRVELPPLRRRPEDIPLLLNHFLKVFSEENGKPIHGFTSEALKMLAAHSWPGNVRELRNTVERMVVMARGTSLSLGDVPAELRAAVAAELAQGGAARPAAAPGTPESDGGTLDLASQERALVLRALRECNGNRSQAARKLGIGRRTLYRKLEEYGISGNG
ncbi:MAG: sigma-54 dependent transcriptional regulator [Lentisphaeria bacterium]|jgi:DNA-binding NtrC family response regulator